MQVRLIGDSIRDRLGGMDEQYINLDNYTLNKMLIMEISSQ